MKEGDRLIDSYFLRDGNTKPFSGLKPLRVIHFRGVPFSYFLLLVLPSSLPSINT